MPISADRATNDDPILRVGELRVHFDLQPGLFRNARRTVRAVDGVSLSIARGRTLGLVGESGCGKTTLGRTILRLNPATSGRIVFDGVDLRSATQRQIRRLRRDMQIIFQDPYGSLNPRMNIESIIGEALGVFGLVQNRRALRERVAALLTRVGLSPDDMRRYPHEFSGGQRQRIGIARALSLEPKFIVCDEPVSALDVSIQAQILNLLADLQRELGLTYLFIAHNLAVVRHLSDDIAVMYLGKIVELAPAEELFRNPQHPYTQALLAAAPEPDPQARRERAPLRGEPPSPIDPPTGCAFHPRCPFAEDRCRVETPQLERRASAAESHLTACHFAATLSFGEKGETSAPLIPPTERAARLDRPL